MKNQLRLCLGALAVSVTLLLASSAFGQTTFTQNTTTNFATTTNIVEKSATTAPNITATFSNLVKAAYFTNSGGVFNFAGTITSGTTLFRGNYATNSKRFHMTNSATMQAATAGGGTFLAISPPNLVTTVADNADYTLTFGPILDIATSNVLTAEALSAIGFVVCSRTTSPTAVYPLDIRATVTYSDLSTESATANVSNQRGNDDTFFGFTAPETLAIKSLRLQSFSPSTTTPVANRIGFDDFGFVTKPAFIPPPPVVENLTPANFAMTTAEAAIHFNVRSLVSISTTDISLTLNNSDVTSQLFFGGNSTNRSVAYSNLVAQTEYTMIIRATNSAGTAALTNTFYTLTNFVVYDSDSFTNDTLYPIGNLQNVTDDRGTWTPHATEPSTIVDVGDPQFKVLQRQVTGASRADFLDFPPISAGTLSIEFDALASVTSLRTFDLCIQPLNAAGTTMGSFLAWGENGGKLAYYNNVDWLPIADLQSGWHHYKILNYLSGPAAGKYDVIVDNTVVAQRLPWRNAAAGSAMSRLRIQAQATLTGLGEYGQIDNLVVTAGQPDLNATLSPTILNVTPANRTIVPPSAGVHFEVTSGSFLTNTDVGMLLNGSPAASLVATNSGTNHVYGDYTTLPEGNYTAQISATNAVGSTSVSTTFMATDEPWLLHPTNAWVGPWEWSGGFPELRIDGPIGTGPFHFPYIRLDLTTTTVRNLMRQAQSGSVDITKPHYIRWQSRLPEDDFASNFTQFNDRIHFFARNAPRLNGGTDANNTWAISATGNEQTAGSGVSTNQIFYIFDNRDGSGNYNGNNLVNSGITLVPYHVYFFEVLVSPQSKTYLVKMSDQTSATYFTSSSPHKFRDISETPHNYLHFGVQTTAAAVPRAFDLDEVYISQAPYAVTLTNAARDASTFSFSFLSQTGMTHTAQYRSNLTTAPWTPLTSVAGDGTTKTITHTNPPGSALFYRVNTQ